MNVILVYDVNKKRVNKIMKICRQYLTRIQNSVFEGSITYSKLSKIKKEIMSVIDPKVDSVCIYELESLKFLSKEEIGAIKNCSKII